MQQLKTKKHVGIHSQCRHIFRHYPPPNYDSLVCNKCGKVFPVKDKNGNWIDFH